MILYREYNLDSQINSWMFVGVVEPVDTFGFDLDCMLGDQNDPKQVLDRARIYPWVIWIIPYLGKTILAK